MKIIKKMVKKVFFAALVVLLLCFTFTTKANDLDTYVIVGGDAIGLNLHTGVFVTGKFNVDSENNLIKGDNIISIDNVKIESVDDLKNVVYRLKQGENVELEFFREGILMKTSAKICDKNGKNTLGIYVKDHVLGVGTLTYVKTEDYSFGSLGHSACSDCVNVTGGNILKCNITGITKGIKGYPGEKKASLDKTIIGSVKYNNDFGVFGKLNDFSINNRDVMKVADIDEVTIGDAVIRTVIEGDKIEEFKVKIVEIEKQTEEDTKGIKYIVTDEKLIEKTGGIIQGMSGSPIIQNNMLIGAVSHVIINDPLTGYGVYAEWMINF